ncbi:MAG: TonB family protein [Paludibacteraceae bacterium]|nr:TonB family protein [Paludibacteraceae bacterium]
MKKLVFGLLLCAFGSVSICAPITDDEIGGVSRGYNAPDESGVYDDARAKRLAEEARIAAEKAAKAAEDARVAAEVAAQAAERARMGTGSNAAAAQARAAAAQKSKEDKARALAAGAFGKGGTSMSGNGSSGDGTGSTPGNPLGKWSGTSNGQSWSLSGRDLVGSIPKPAYIGNQEGVVVVLIIVDRNGNVVGTKIGKGTTISNEALRNECMAKARKIKFSTNPKQTENQIGSITYRFKSR